ncbi:MAG TPA: metallophosphoesterase [Pirellulaceae bacterium]|nr:metallophosphoesterase [Pirellulaceae bacterium]
MKKKLLLFSDLHCDLELAREVVAKSRDADLLIGAGDFGTCRRGTRETIAALSGITKPTILTPGNSESHEELTEACRNWPAARVLHGSGAKIDGIDFYGLGYAVPTTPFGAWSCDLSESDAETMLAGCPDGGVLVCHSPPHGLVDTDSRGRSLGSTSIRRVVELRRPKLVVCGHVHASGGRQTLLESTQIVNTAQRTTIIELDIDV